MRLIDLKTHDEGSLVGIKRDDIDFFPPIIQNLTKKHLFCVAFCHFHRIISMERLKYISLTIELRQIAVARAFTLLNDKEDAEDMAGEVMLRLWERHSNLRDNAEEVRHFADTMAKNLSLDLLRRRRRHPLLRLFHRHDSDEDETGYFPDVPDSSTPQQQIEDEEAGNILQRAMNQLPYKWRRIVEMREREDMSFAEIAQVLGTSESSCRGMMSKARQRLLQLISKMTE